MTKLKTTKSYYNNNPNSPSEKAAEDIFGEGVSSPPQMSSKPWRDRISEIFIRNGLPTHQVAISQLCELMKDAFDAGEEIANAKREI